MKDLVTNSIQSFVNDIICSDSEENVSELLKTLEEFFSWYCMDGDVMNRFEIATKHRYVIFYSWCV